MNSYVFHILIQTGKQRIYIVDFIDNKNKIIYQIKPAACVDNEVNKIKQQAAINWCKENNYSYQLITDSYFQENARKINFKKYDKRIYYGMMQFL